MADENFTEVKGGKITDQPQGWFERFAIGIIRRYAKNASTDNLAKKYPGLPRDVIADRFIGQQAQAAALIGGLSAGGVTVAEVASTASAITAVGLPALAITLPAGIVAFAADLASTARLQIKTAFDLCQLYGVTIDPDDPEELWDIFALGMGVRAGEATASAMQKLAPAVFQQQARRLMRTGIRRWFQDWAGRNLSWVIARKYLTEKFLLGVVVPGLNIFLGAGFNYYATLNIGRAVRVYARSRGLSLEQASQLSLPASTDPNLVLATALIILNMDVRIQDNELVAYKQLGRRLSELHPTFVPTHLEGEWVEPEAWLARAADLSDPESRKALYAIAETFAILDGKIGRREKRLIKELSRLYGLPFDEQRLKIRAKPFYVPPAGRGCQIVALVIGIMLILAACACSISAYWLVARLISK